MSSLTFADRPVSTFRRARLLALAASAAPCRLPRSSAIRSSLGAPARRLHRAIGSRLEAGRKGLAIRTLYAGASFAALLTLAAPGHAAPRPIDVPAGTVGQAAFAIGRQAGISISIPDRSLLWAGLLRPSAAGWKPPMRSLAWRRPAASS